MLRLPHDGALHQDPLSNAASCNPIHADVRDADDVNATDMTRTKDAILHVWTVQQSTSSQLFSGTKHFRHDQSVSKQVDRDWRG